MFAPGAAAWASSTSRASSVFQPEVVEAEARLVCRSSTVSEPEALLLALLEAGVVVVVRLGRPYLASKAARSPAIVGSL